MEEHMVAEKNVQQGDDMHPISRQQNIRCDENM
jgi:hypothetical protein